MLFLFGEKQTNRFIHLEDLATADLQLLFWNRYLTKDVNP